MQLVWAMRCYDERMLIGLLWVPEAERRFWERRRTASTNWEPIEWFLPPEDTTERHASLIHYFNSFHYNHSLQPALSPFPSINFYQSVFCFISPSSAYDHDKKSFIAGIRTMIAFYCGELMGIKPIFWQAHLPSITSLMFSWALLGNISGSWNRKINHRTAYWRELQCKSNYYESIVSRLQVTTSFSVDRFSWSKTKRQRIKTWPSCINMRVLCTLCTYGNLDYMCVA